VPRRATTQRPLCPGYAGGQRKCYLTKDGSPCRNHDPVSIERRREIGKHTGWRAKLGPVPDASERRELALRTLISIQNDKGAPTQYRTKAAELLLDDADKELLGPTAPPEPKKPGGAADGPHGPPPPEPRHTPSLDERFQ
jgi:hypothetical protein